MLQKGQSAKLVPAEPGLLAEPSRWVDSWQEPTGHTNYDAALQMAERFLEADCEYIFSDGLSDYAVVLLEVQTVSSASVWSGCQLPKCVLLSVPCDTATSGRCVSVGFEPTAGTVCVSL